MKAGRLPFIASLSESSCAKVSKSSIKYRGDRRACRGCKFSVLLRVIHWQIHQRFCKALDQREWGTQFMTNVSHEIPAVFQFR